MEYKKIVNKNKKTNKQTFGVNFMLNKTQPQWRWMEENNCFEQCNNDYKKYAKEHDGDVYGRKTKL